ncbi:psbP domain-containing protein 2, chloroplastic [Vigna radiata var. radiata]|uniref:PsbP domain-containing protein 2, chloroplastic n=1 Tax=Vigna radiata var. radiata TaxID=3916 RepID=A0A1S3UI51_VIGRR|nr:psbP domain-containing protein 2, chloroplastic [Vigna radiata var. radiata]XP_014505723.1 psbP domain-containing protein 2, chloroplastic [Vigna radiata var. radiata]
MALRSSFTFSRSTFFHQRSQSSYASSRIFVSILLPKSTSLTCIHESQKDMHLAPSFSKRNLNFTLLLTMFLWGQAAPLPNMGDARLWAQELELQRYTDSEEGFTLLIPSSWAKVDKAGATVLFEEKIVGSNNIGVVVSPVRLKTLEEFGTPQFVADKLLQAEKRKESTKEAELITVAERSGEGGLQIYEFEYKVDSTRGGMKRIFSAAFVASKKLYLLNIAHSDKPESPLDPHKRMILEQVLHSFDAAA